MLSDEVQYSSLLFMKDTPQTYTELKKERDTLQHRLFLLILEIAFWFGIPAFGAFFLGNFLDGRYETGHRYLILLLITAFVLSWIAIIWRLKSITKRLVEVEKQMRIQSDNAPRADVPVNDD